MVAIGKVLYVRVMSVVGSWEADHDTGTHSVQVNNCCQSQYGTNMAVV